MGGYLISCFSMKDREMIMELNGGVIGGHEIKLIKIERKMDGEAINTFISEKLRILEELQTWESSFGENSKTETKRPEDNQNQSKFVPQEPKNAPKYPFKAYQPPQNSGNWRNQGGPNNGGKGFWFVSIYLFWNISKYFRLLWHCSEYSNKSFLGNELLQS